MKNTLRNMPDAPSKEVIAWREDLEKEICKEVVDGHKIVEEIKADPKRSDELKEILVSAWESRIHAFLEVLGDTE